MSAKPCSGCGEECRRTGAIGIFIPDGGARAIPYALCANCADALRNGGVGADQVRDHTDSYFEALLSESRARV